MNTVKPFGLTLLASRKILPAWVLTASGVVPIVDLDFANGRYFFNRRLYPAHADLLTAIGGTHTRADATTCATYFDSAGVLQLAAANVLRFDHDPATLAAKGILLEGTRTNLQIRSNNPGLWGIVNMSGTANGAEGLDGTMSAFLIPTDGASAYGQTNHTIAADTGKYAVTFFLKPITPGFGTFKSGTIGMIGVDVSTPIYDFATASFRTGGAGWTVSAGPNGFTKFTRVFTNNGAATNFIMRVDRDADNLYQMAFGGGQLEKAGFSSSYIHTTTAAVTRAADSYTIGPTGGVPFTGFNASEGAFVVYYDKSNVAAAVNQAVMSINDNTANQRIVLYSPGTNPNASTLYAYKLTLQVDSIVLGDGKSANTTIKTAFVYKLNDYAGSCDGAAIVPDTNATVPTVDRMHIGTAEGGTLPHFGHASRIAYFASRISNADLVTLTT